MDVDDHAHAPTSYRPLLILDTNVLLNHLDTISRFVEDAQRNHRSIQVLIPGIVIRELDNMKATDRLGWPSRRATRWIAGSLKEGSVFVRSQALHETCKASRDWTLRNRGEDNDDMIFDYSLYISKNSDDPRRVILCTSDQNLQIKALANDINILEPLDPWSSRQLATQISLIQEPSQDSSGHNKPQTHEIKNKEESYAEQEKIYKTLDDVMDVDELRAMHNPTVTLPHIDDDAMDVDEVDYGPVTIQKMSPSEALRLLHLQVVDQYTGLIKDLVRRLLGSARQDTRQSSRSKWSPKWSKTSSMDWSLTDSLEFLARKSSLSVKHQSLLVMFLTKPYCGRGARRGDLWPPSTWEEALSTLTRLGADLGDSAFADSMDALDAPFHEIFERRLVENLSPTPPGQ